MIRSARWFLWLWLLASGCRCTEVVGGVEVGFRVEEELVDFGPVLELDSAVRTVTVVSTGRAALTLDVSTEGPFTAPPKLDLPGGSEVKLEVSFTAGNGPAAGKLRLSAVGNTVTVNLLGEGVRPLPCLPSAVCRVVRFDLQTNSCVESAAPNGSGCIPSSMCLENGLCQEGRCVGVQRSCDDRNQCTSDGCAEGVGCVNTVVACPSSGNPCMVPVCDPERGCSEIAAPDGTQCGAIDCVTAHLCAAGECKAVPAPDGLLCAPRTPCQAEGRCQMQQCLRPDAGIMTPSHVVPLSDPPSDPHRVLAYQGNLFVGLCGPGGDDAGCRLFSVTGSGFERFSVLQPDGGVRKLLNVSEHGVTMLAPHALESYSAGTGALQWQVPFSSLSPPLGLNQPRAVCEPERVSMIPGGQLVAALTWQESMVLSTTDAGADAGADGGDGGGSDAGDFDGGPPLQTVVWISSDGGVLSQGAVAEPGYSLVASDNLGHIYMYEPAGPLSSIRQDGTGVSSQKLGDFPGARSLLMTHEVVWSGGRHLVGLDGGTLASLNWSGPGGEPYTLHGPQLMSRDRGYAFYKSCVPAAMSCPEEQRSTTVRAFTAGDGGVQWEAKVLPEGLLGSVVESALAQGGAVLTLTESRFDAGPGAYVQAFANGKRLFVCPLPEGSVPTAAVFERGYLHALIPYDGGWRLEAFNLEQIPMETLGWPQSGGVSGSRQAR